MKANYLWAVPILVIVGVAASMRLAAPRSGAGRGSESGAPSESASPNVGIGPGAIAEPPSPARREEATVPSPPRGAAPMDAIGDPESREADGADAAPAQRLAGIVATLRSIAADESFHRLAWPLIEEAKRIGRDSAAREILASLIAGGRECDRVAGALLFALVGALPAEDRESVLLANREGPSPELARVAWIASSLEWDTPSKLGVPIGRFTSRTNGRTYPLVLDQRPSPSDVEDAIRFLERPILLVPPPSGQADGLDPKFQDGVFAKEIAAIAVLGPAAEAVLPDEVAGRARSQLWQWLESPAPSAVLLGDAAAFCLASAARAEPSLGERLLEFAARSSAQADASGQLSAGGDPRPAAVRWYLARFGILGERLAGQLGDLLRGERAPGAAFERALAIRSIGELLGSDAGPVSLEAARVALDRILDARQAPIERIQLMDWLAISHHELLLYTASTVLDFETDPKIVANAVHDLGCVREADRAGAAGVLVRRFDPNAPEVVRSAIATSLGKVGDPSIVGFLVDVARTDASPSTRLSAQHAVANVLNHSKE
jgi:hypothetical protein